MKVAALLALLAALPAHAGGPVSPEQARTNVVKAMNLPPELEKGAETGDLQRYLAGLLPKQREAALLSLTAKADELGGDPATLAIMGQAYAGLGEVKKARQAAERIRRERPNDPDADRLMRWVNAQERLPGREGGGGPSGPPASARVSPASAGARPANALEARLQSLFRRGKNSPEFNSTMSKARGMSVAQLKEEGITFRPAEPGQKDAVMIEEGTDGTFTVSLREDALNSGGDREARAAAHLANGVRQAQTLRDHEVIGWVLVKARGWFTGAQTHKELAPNDFDRNPQTPSDQNLMAARKILDQKTNQFVPGEESYGKGDENSVLEAFNSLINVYGLDQIFPRFIKMTGRGDAP